MSSSNRSFKNISARTSVVEDCWASPSNTLVAKSNTAVARGCFQDEISSENTDRSGRTRADFPSTD